MALAAAKIVASIEAVRDKLGLGGDCVIAYSGGLDSTVLMHLLARDGRLPLRALHIDHGLQEEPAWQRHVKRATDALGLPCRVVSLQLKPGAGDSIEALARDARYAAFAADLQAGDLLLLAQHRDDQAETLLLQLLRGAGPHGLSAMPRLAALGPGYALRPLLDVSVDQLRDYARVQGLSWFDDPSNADERFDRNYLRHRVLPAMRERWPAFGKTLARAAHHQSAAASVLDQQAAADARSIRARGGQLVISRLQMLTTARQRNVLRFVLRARGLAVPSDRRLGAVLALCQSPAGRGQVAWADVVMRRYRDALFFTQGRLEEPDTAFEVALRLGASIELPCGLGTLKLAGSKVAGHEPPVLSVRFRRGGERARLAARGHSQPLAQWFQEQGVPPWERSRVPLAFWQGDLVGIGDTLVTAQDGMFGSVRLVWERPT
ncbi:MAG: tRNA lysidine(34) synthetase TilS [Pseudomonadota bacterium]